MFNPYIESQLAPTSLHNNASMSSPKSPSIVKDRKIRVSDPEKESDGHQSTYMSYLITSDIATVRRRFQDFVWLYNVLTANYPACFVPSLPEKHRMEYVRGDRFAEDFVEKRRASLQTFIERLGRHPILSKSQYFQMFLSSPQFNDASARALREQQETMLDSISDSVLNAFSKIKKPDERFVHMKEQLDKLEENLTLLEKTLNRTNKRQDDLHLDYKEFSTSMQGLAHLESGITVPILRFAETISEYSKLLKAQSDSPESDWISEIHEYLAYCTAVKTVLKLRDQKQVDFEELTEYLTVTEKERERTMYPTMMDRGLNITGFLTDKLQEVRGVDSEKMRREKILKLDMRIRELQEATEQSKEVTTSFSDQVEKEYQYFEQSRTVEIKNALASYTDARCNFFSKQRPTFIMSVYEKKATQRKGNNKKGAQAHQNQTAWKPNKNSKISRTINALPVYGLCNRCTDVILWRKKYKKYKPLTAPKKCTSCQQKTIKEAYHVLCDNCASNKKVCAKCLESKEIVTEKSEIKSDRDLQKEEQELERLLSRMTLRQRRSYLRKLERGEDLSHIKAEDFDDDDFEFDIGSDLDDDFEEEDEDDDSDK
ncbi:intercellular trafficking and secretion, variant 2 [Umbelopsis sp. WA50703]